MRIMGNQKETQKNPQYKYASTREKLCFGIALESWPICDSESGHSEC